MKRLLAAAAVALLTACASTPVDLATAPHVPEERILDKSFLVGGAGKVPVTVSFDRLNDIGTMTFTLAIDSNEVAHIKPGEKAALFVTEGRHVLSSYLGVRKVFLSSHTDVFTDGSAAYTYRLFQDLDGKVTLLPM